MKRSVKIVSGVLGFGMLLPGIAKFFDPFKTSLQQQLSITEMPFPEVLEYFVKFGEIAIGLILLTLAFKGTKLAASNRRTLFNLSHLAVAVIMVVALYVHLHPEVPAEILPMGMKPPFLTLFYLALVAANFYLNRSVQK
jgi:hypothetical protein